MINFILGVYALGFVLAFIVSGFFIGLGGKSKSFLGVFASAWAFAMFWPITIWFLNKI